MIPHGPVHLSIDFIAWRLPAAYTDRDHAGSECRTCPVYKLVPDELLWLLWTSFSSSINW